MAFDISEYPKLKDAIQKGNLVIFVGAGTSVNLKNKAGNPIGNWKNLVRQILLNLDGDGKKFDYLVALLDKYEPIEVLRLIEKNSDIQKTDVQDFLKKFINLSHDNDYGLHKKLASLANTIITTNYDGAFEESNESLEANVAYTGKNYELTTHKDNRPFLFKLHGCWRDADSMVLFPSKYDELYGRKSTDAEHTQMVLRNLVYNKNILFVGCGMGDFQINHIFSEIKGIQGGYNQLHFLISKDKPAKELDFLNHIAIEDHPEIESIVDALLKVKTDWEIEKDREKIENLKKIGELQNELESSKSKYKPLINELFKEANEFASKEEYDKAIIKLNQISYINKYYSVYNNWGLYIKEKSRFEQDVATKKKVLLESIEKYTEAIKIKTDYDTAYNNWGISLTNLAKLESGEKREALYLESFQKYEKATLIDPNYFRAYNNWANAIGHFAKTKFDGEKEKLLQESVDKYETANQINKNNPVILYNCGQAYRELAASKEEKSRAKLFKKAEDYFLKAVKYDGQFYNLACLYAILDRKKEAYDFLEKSMVKNETSISHIKTTDPDWEKYRTDPDFINLIAKYQTNMP